MDRVLVANRGEVALRLCRAAATLGLEAVALRTADEPDAPHARLADAVMDLPGEGPAAYLDVEAVVDAAVRADAALVHPGYGFLSESPALARACARAGLTFVGPAPEVLELLGDKVRARALAQRLDIPVLRAVEGTVAAGRELLETLGPDAAVMVKAVAGGGGRGMRVVRSGDVLAAALASASGEAERAFGDGTVYIEELLEEARHIEVQVIGDGTRVTHLWDRDCSLQRRRQKLVEIAPAVTVADDLRERVLDAAVRLADEVGYRGVGTVEMLVQPRAGRFVFMEANPRLQVEHTVTEQVTGVDLVVAQLRLAQGATLADLGLGEGPPAARGVAVQARVSAERVQRDGRAIPTTGTVMSLELPTGPGVRVDTHLGAGTVITGHFDALLVKVIGHGHDLPSALRLTERALAELRTEGMQTGADLLRAILRRSEVAAGDTTTTFVEQHLAELVPEPDDACDGVLERDGDLQVRAELLGTVLSVEVEPGDRVPAGQALVVLEAMKMEHLVVAPCPATVLEVVVQPGDTVCLDEVLLRLEPGEHEVGEDDAAEQLDLDHIRPDLQAVIDRHRPTLDEARPEAVEKRHRTGHRTARENIADLCDSGTFHEYGALAIAAQRQRRTLEDLVARTPADGIVTGTARINGASLGDERAACAVIAYDYTVLAGTQGYLNHKKTDRLLELAERRRLPLVLFAEGGGGRPGDTDTTSVSGLDVGTFAAMGRLNGLVPTVGIVTGRCFAGNAALLGCCDVVIATRDANIGMGGPAMIEGGGLGAFRPEEIGPSEVQSDNGVIDVLVEDEAEAVAIARQYLSYFQGAQQDWAQADQRELRHVVPENRRRPYDVRRLIELLADTDSVLELRSGFGRGMVTALARIEGRPVGFIANNPKHLGGAIDAVAADKLTRFLQLCDAHGVPVVSLCDTPGFMVGPDAEKTATVRHFARAFVTGAALSVPLVVVVVRKGYGLGAQAMAGGSFREPVATLAWPTGEIGGMGLEGAVRLGYRRELEAAPDDAARQQLFDELVTRAYEHGRATNAAQAFELDGVIDPVETRSWVSASLWRVRDSACQTTGMTSGIAHSAGVGRLGRRRIDTW